MGYRYTTFAPDLRQRLRDISSWPVLRLLLVWTHFAAQEKYATNSDSCAAVLSFKNPGSRSAGALIEEWS